MTSSAADLGDDSRFASLVVGLIALVGEDWVREVNELPDLRTILARSPGSQDGAHMLRALRAHTSSADDAQTVRDRGDPQLRLMLGAMALIIAGIAPIDGSARIRDELRNLARAWQFERFFDKLFEAEAALHWASGRGEESVSFPTGHNPDFWFDAEVAGFTYRYPNECKRIQPEDPDGMALESLADALEAKVRELWSTIGAHKVTVWLHVPAEGIPTELVVSQIADLGALAHAGGSNAWHTRSDNLGRYQLTVACAPELHELASRVIDLWDIPFVPLRRVCTVSEYRGTQADPIRLKYALSLRSDVLPSRTGAFERNLRKALTQVSKANSPNPGIVNIRLRPPRDFGDLYEADAIARRILASPEGKDLTLVCLFWNESERTEEPIQVDGGQAGREVTAMWHLKVHYVAQRRPPVDFSGFDSAAGQFPVIDGIVIRDPNSGTIIPVYRDVLELLDNPTTVEPLPGMQVDPNDHTSSFYLKLPEPFRKDVSQVLRVFRIADRIFMARFTGELGLQVIEFVRRQPVRVATIDLRAWLGELEFLFRLHSTDADWWLQAEHANEVTEARARPAWVPEAFL